MTIVEIERVSAPDIERRDAREERARILEAAALEIEVRGHVKETFMDESGAVCAGGAIACANGWNGEGDAWKLWDTFLQDRESFFPHYNDLPWFNNAKDTTAEDVTFLLRWRAQEILDGR